MTTFYTYHKCSTCRKAQAYLDQAGVEYETIELIETPPTQATILQWMKDNNYPIRTYFNTSGQVYRQENLKEVIDQLTLEEAAAKLASNGMLIKRPVLTKGKTALFGFKEEAYQALLK